MKTVNSALTAKEIRTLNLKETDVLGFDYEWENGVDNNYLNVNGKRFISFSSWKDRDKSVAKIKRMGLGLGLRTPILSDEEEGIIQSVKLGFNPFAYSIICSNPALNKIVK
jgi:hypothetical protein